MSDGQWLDSRDGTAVLLDADGLLVTTTPISAGLWSFEGLAAGDYFAHIFNNLGLTDVTLGDSTCATECQPLDGGAFTVGASGFTEDVVSLPTFRCR